MITQNTVVLLERSLRPLCIPFRPYEDCKRGSASSCLALLKRLLFHTSAQVAAQVASRHAGSLNSLSERKIILLAFDILRDLCRFQPPITPEQFMSKSSYGEQKLKILTRLAEHVLVYFEASGAQVGVGGEVLAAGSGSINGSNFVYVSLPPESHSIASLSSHSFPAPILRQSISLGSSGEDGGGSGGGGNVNNNKRASFSISSAERRDEDRQENFTSSSSSYVSPSAQQQQQQQQQQQDRAGSGVAESKSEIVDLGLHELGAIGEDLKLQLFRVLTPHQRNQLTTIFGESEKDSEAEQQLEIKTGGKRKGKGVNPKRVGARLRSKPRKDTAAANSSTSVGGVGPEFDSPSRGSYIPFAVDLSLGENSEGGAGISKIATPMQFRSELHRWMTSLVTDGKVASEMAASASLPLPLPLPSPMPMPVQHPTAIPPQAPSTAPTPARTRSSASGPTSSKPSPAQRRSTFFVTSNEDEDDDEDDDDGDDDDENVGSQHPFAQPPSSPATPSYRASLSLSAVALSASTPRDPRLSVSIEPPQPPSHLPQQFQFGDVLLQRLEKRLSENLNARIAAAVEVAVTAVERRYQDYLLQLSRGIDDHLNLLGSRIAACEKVNIKREREKEDLRWTQSRA